MSAEIQITPTSIYLDHISLARVIVVKNIAKTSHTETLINYLEVICRQEVVHIYFSDYLRSVALAIFKDDIVDLDTCVSRAWKRTLDSHNLQLYSTSQPTAILVSDIPDLHTHDPLLYYFEHHSSGISEGGVQHCQLFSTIHVAIVTFDHPCSALPGVLSRTHHLLGTPIRIEPYFPEFHDSVIQFLKKASESSDSLNTCPPSEQQVNPKGTEQQVIRNTTFGLSSQKKPTHPKEMAENVPRLFPEQDNAESSSRSPPKSSTKLKLFTQSNDGQWREEIEMTTSPESDVKPLLHPSFSTENVTEQVENIILQPDKDMSESPNIPPLNPKHPKRPKYMDVLPDIPQVTDRFQKQFGDASVENYSPNLDMDTEDRSCVKNKDLHQFLDEDDFPIRFNRSQSGSVPSVVTDNEKEYSHWCLPRDESSIRTTDVDSTRQQMQYVQNSAGAPVFNENSMSPHIQVGQSHLIEEVVKLDTEKIALLKLSDLTKSADSCKITWNVENGKVTFKGNEDSIHTSKLLMYEILNFTEERYKDVPAGVLSLLSSSRGKSLLKQPLVKNKLRAVAYVKDGKVCCKAFTQQDAVTGLDVIVSTLSSDEVSISPDQSACLTDKPWMDLKEQLTSQYLVDMKIQKKKVLISGGTSDVSIVKSKVKQFLDQHTPAISPSMPSSLSGERAPPVKDQQQRWSVTQSVMAQPQTLTFCGAKARCLHQKFLEEFNKVKAILRPGNGDVNLVFKEDSLVVEVTGPQAIISKGTAQVADIERRIWHQRLDWSKMAKTAKEISVVSCSLMCETGKQFMREFESTHNCFIDVETTNEVQEARFHPKRNSQEYRDIDALQEARFHPKRNSQEYRDYDAFQEARERNSQASRDERFEPILRAESLPDLHMVQSDSSGGSDDYATTDSPSPDREDSPEFWRPDTDLQKFSPPHRDVRHLLDTHPTAPQTSLKPVKSIKVGNIKINIEQGDITVKRADSLVNVVGTSLSLEESTVASKFLKVAGPNLKQNFDAAAANFDASSTSVICTESSGQLKCNMVFHVVLQKYHSVADKVNLLKCVTDCVELCEMWGSHYIAFPAVGAGRLLHYPPDVVADCLVTAAVNAANSGTSTLKSISFVVYDPDIVKKFSQVLDQKSSQNTTLDQDPALVVGATFPTVTQDIDPVARLFQNLHRQTPRPLQQQNNFMVGNPLEKFYNKKSDCQKIPQLERTRTHVYDRPKSAYQERSRTADRVRGYHESPSDRVRRHSRKYYESPSDRVRRHSRGRHHSPPDRGDYGQHRRNTDHQAVKLARPDVTEPCTVANVKVWAENRRVCEDGCDQLVNNLRLRFLHKDHIDNACIQNISDSCCKKIYSEARQYGVYVTIKKDKKKISVKGDQTQVNKCVKKIYQLLLDEDKDSSSHNQIRRRRSNLKRGTKEYWIEVADFPEIPPYWDHFKHGASLLDVFKKFIGKPRHERIAVGDNVKQAIIDLVNRTWRSDVVGKGNDAVGLSHSKIQIKRVERIESLNLYTKYTNKRAELFRKLVDRGCNSYPAIDKLPRSSGPVATSTKISQILMHDIYPEINEHFFFHGTKPENVKNILTQGLESRIGDAKAMFGPGAYGAESPTKADQYADSKTQRTTGEKSMFLVRMALGHPFLCSQSNPSKYRKAPCMNMSCLRDNCTKHHDSFDSVIGDGKWLFREFVVYSPDQCYPEYLITYVRK
ncbi:hypothetical protein ScPMuIL_010252 [Solemya velum]